MAFLHAAMGESKPITIYFKSRHFYNRHPGIFLRFIYHMSIWKIKAVIFRGEGERKGDKKVKPWANINFQWDFSIVLLKAFWKTHSDQFATIADTRRGCGSPVRVLKTATPPRNTLKTTPCSMNLCTSGRCPKAASDGSCCLCLVHLLHSLIPRKKEEILYLSFFPSFGLFAPRLCTVL